MRSDRPIMAPHAQTIEVTATLLGTDPAAGLAQTSIGLRLKRWGENAIPEDAPVHSWQLLLRQFWDPVVLILLVAAILSFIFKDPWEGVAIVAVIVISVSIGFFMERKAHRTLKALRKMGQARARVKRSGISGSVQVSNLVPGDLVILGPEYTRDKNGWQARS